MTEQSPSTRVDRPDPTRWGRSPTWERSVGGASAAGAGWATDPRWEGSGPAPVVDDPSGLTALGGDPLGAAGARRRRAPRVPRLAIGGSLALVAAGALAAGAVGIRGLVDGGGAPTAGVDPPARIDLAPALRAIEATGEGWADYLAAARAAESTRRNEIAAERRRRELARIRRQERRRAEALAANQVVSAPRTAPAETAPVESAPEAPADPWGGVSPMVRATTPGPWNGGGAS